MWSVLKMLWVLNVSNVAFQWFSSRIVRKRLLDHQVKWLHAIAMVLGLVALVASHLGVFSSLGCGRCPGGSEYFVEYSVVALWVG